MNVNCSGRFLAMYFSSTFTSENTEYIPTLSSNPFPDIPSIVYSKLTRSSTYTCKNLQTHKCGGPDNLLAHFLKELSVEIAPALAMIFQASLNQGVAIYI